MGFTLDETTVRLLSATIASEVVKALYDAKLVTKSHEAPAMRIPGGEAIQAGPIMIDLSRREAKVRGRVLALKPRELDCLSVLARNAGTALSRRQLLELAWGDVALDRVDSERTVDVHVRRLRIHLGQDAKLLRTIARIGYRLDPA